MLKRIIVTIASGHNIGVYEIGLQISLKLRQLVSHKVTVIDLDSFAKTHSRTYSDKDYNFQQICDDLSLHHNDLEIVLVCGCYALYDKNINKLSNLKIFIESEADKRLINLVESNDLDNIEELNCCISHYMDNLKPEMVRFIEPTRLYADLIIPDKNKSIGTEIIVDGIIKVIEDMQGFSIMHTKKTVLHPNFNMERMDIHKERYYDLS